MTGQRSHQAPSSADLIQRAIASVPRKWTDTLTVQMAPPQRMLDALKELGIATP